MIYKIDHIKIIINIIAKYYNCKVSIISDKNFLFTFKLTFLNDLF